MIAVDTSVLCAVILGEPDAEHLLRALQNNRTLLSAASLVEATMVVEARQGPEAARDLELLVTAAIDEVVPLDADAAALAIAAWRRFGRGRHPAALNYGDCFSYALAQQRQVPLLFKGDDFTQTDVARA